MPHFILFFGVLINAAEHYALYIVEEKTTGNGLLVCVPKGQENMIRISLPAPYEQAKAEWETMLKQPPAHAHTHTHE